MAQEQDVGGTRWRSSTKAFLVIMYAVVVESYDTLYGTGGRGLVVESASKFYSAAKVHIKVGTGFTS